ncbi:Dabb family protein [Kineosporia babensis]|uniref:Dabb family protein n=1 Tax=Kineosporia babensis TaxID=499548 RepID=A0A9X1NKT6_9ACTN|nr:Dabb family protein [Kineosporia babensis]MCD5316787.1 Dabb family protein [Kineosporia babensis]
MIRNVVMGRLKPGADTDLLEKGLAGIVALAIPGMTGVKVGRDAGLREGNWDFTITADFADVAAYRAYDEDEEHNRLRREIFGPLSEEIARIQIEV